MREYITPAIILDREPSGEYDERISFLSRQFGKLIARTISSRKILSKLSAHLEPGNVTTLRLVEQNDLSIVDALKESTLPWAAPNLFHLNHLLVMYDPDSQLWTTCLRNPHWKNILRVLGWNPEEASCEICETLSPNYFDTSSQHFFCNRCYLRIPEKATIIDIRD